MKLFEISKALIFKDFFVELLKTRRQFFRNFSLSLASISCITITLIVVAISIVLSANVDRMTKHVSSNISIVVFLDKKYDKDNVREIEEKIKAVENVNIDGMKINSKKEYAEEIKNSDEMFSLIVNSWTESNIPLLASFEVPVLDINTIDVTAKTIENIEGVSLINYGEEYISTAIKIFDVMEKVCIGGVVALILVTAFLISNTIKLAIFARKTEIEIMRLVGASNVAIKTPFLIEGSFIGFLGSIIPIGLMAYGYHSLYTMLGGKLLSGSFGNLIEPFPFIFIAGGILLLIGLLVGMIGSANAVKRYLKI